MVGDPARPGADDGAPAPTLPFARRLARELAGVAAVRVDAIDGGVLVTVTPNNPEACPFGWRDFSDSVVTQVGAHGYSGRWTLAAEPVAEDVAAWGEVLDLGVLDDIARSVIAGRVQEVHGWGASEVAITFGDAAVVACRGAAPAASLPLFLWRRWSRSVRYAPYR